MQSRQDNILQCKSLIHGIGSYLQEHCSNLYMVLTGARLGLDIKTGAVLRESIKRAMLTVFLSYK